MSSAALRRRKTGPKLQVPSEDSLVPSEIGSEESSPDATTPKSRRQPLARPYAYVRGTLLTRRIVFPLGLLLGMVFAVAVFPTYSEDLAFMLEQYDLSLPSFSNISLAIIDLEWRHLSNNLLEGAKQWTQTRDFTVGTELKERGFEAKHPVVLIPGIVSTGLESWSTSPEYRHYFRKRLWGTTTMIRAVVTERDKWIAALMLDPETGLDPPGVKVRAAQGLDAASTFIPGYWIWSKVIENLACINYDTNNLELSAYDWRVSYYNLEIRDGYFSKLKSTIECFRKKENRKVVLVAHSMGSTLILYFLKWVEAPGFGDGGPGWVDYHVESFVNVAGTLLGVPKAMTAFLSGEMKDTVELNPAGSYVLEKFFSRKDRAKLFRSWAGSASMWLKGGNAIWGNGTHAPDDLDGNVHTHGHLFSFRAPTAPQAITSMPDGQRDLPTVILPTSTIDLTKPGPPGPPIPSVETNPGVGNLTAEEAGNWILEHTPNAWQRMLQNNYSYGFELDEAQLIKNNLDHRKWSNPLEIQLPNAPNMKIYCVYGHGKDTERSYWYARGEFEHDEMVTDDVSGACLNTTGCDLAGMSPRPPLDMPLNRANWIDALVTGEGIKPRVKNGVKIGEGDGTVPLLSLGAMCVEGWKRKRWNPAGIKVITYEMPHRPEGLDIRGGANTSDHVDVLGSRALNEIVLKVAAGRGDEVQDHFVSDIRRYAQRIPWDG